MVQIALSEEMFLVDNNQFVGLNLVGCTYDKAGAILKIDRSRLFHLAQACEEPYKSLFFGILGLLIPPPPAMPSQTGGPSEGVAARLPKKYKPYVRYTDEQVKAAWEKSELKSNRHYAYSGQVRLYLTRAMLEEMYRQPRHLRIIYADMMKKIDEATPGYTNHLCSHFAPSPPPDWGTKGRFRPYESLTEKEMRQAAQRLSIYLCQAKPSYGYFGVTLRRESLLMLTRRPPYTTAAMACLLKLFDSQRTGQTEHNSATTFRQGDSSR